MAYHNRIRDIPRRIWERLRSGRSLYKRMDVTVNHFRAFGEYGFKPVLATLKKKHDDRSMLVRYLFQCENSHYQVIVPSLYACFAVGSRTFSHKIRPPTRRRTFGRSNHRYKPPNFA